jgi:hypothetical protein
MLVLQSRLLARAGFAHGFPLRSAPEAALLHALSAAAVVQVKQVHGARAVDADDAAAGVEADAIVGRRPSVAVGVRVADCVPVLVANEASGDVAAIHAGWRGVVAGVVRSGVGLLGGGKLLAAIGPCIGPCCFEVGRDVADRIASASTAEAIVLPASGDKAHADLRRAVRAQLGALGLPDDRVDDVPGCTKHEPARFHSFRRDGAQSGRMLAAIMTRVGPP